MLMGKEKGKRKKVEVVVHHDRQANIMPQDNQLLYKTNFINLHSPSYLFNQSISCRHEPLPIYMSQIPLASLALGFLQLVPCS